MTRTALATDDHGRHGPVRIVVVADHDDDILDLITIVLEGMDVAVHRAEDGEHAVALCREHRPQVLLLDVAVHGMSAVDVCRTVRADPALAEVRVILTVARAGDSDVQAGMEAGAETYVIKPFGPIELRDVFSGRQDGP